MNDTSSAGPARLDTGPADAPIRLVLAHGAGAAMTSPFLTQMADLLAQRGVGVTRFEFGYMAARRSGGNRRPPPAAAKLEVEYEAMVRTLAAEAPAQSPTGQRLVIGGKSMGGRVASMVAGRLAAEGHVAGLVCLGYPFHPPGLPHKLRTEHLETLECPSLIVQGERDPFGSAAEVAELKLSPAITVIWLPDGDHDFGPRGASGHTRKGNLTAAADAVAGFLARLPALR